ncbi:MAG: hypothetical protein GWN31_14565, partial [Candidatus Thorarchaeota archaeon]|nr:hypothetical protein [Nitrosopumilaceae archaeon]NIV66656.1 hypothetical protein [Nitrosopumilaceae archaeon]NIW15117.1 hypothetical protein [Candidatus Thorarchaeota archaeon]NIX63190.1 hypothetical protein [Nitrosopumilaceae archaeon]
MNEINKISNTFDVSKQRASLTDEKELEERGLLDKAGSQFVAGVGDLMSLVGGFGKRSNFLTDESPLMDWMVDEGTRLQQSYGVK